MKLAPDQMPQVSIIILNCNYLHNILRLLPSLTKTSGVLYETVVVDNGSTPDVVEVLRRYQADGWLDKLILNPTNLYFSEGNNVGVRHSDPRSEFILLLNNDTEILDGLWLHRMIEWAEGVPKTLLPYTWSDQPTCPKNIRRGIVSMGWGYDRSVPGCVRPEGWCVLIRREAWREMSPDFPMFMGDMEMMAGIVRDGYACGCLARTSWYIVHHHGGSLAMLPPDLGSRGGRQADMKTWWSGLTCESLDFTVSPTQSPYEPRSYMDW